MRIKGFLLTGFVTFAAVILLAPVASGMPGTGTPADPYLVTTCQDLSDVRNDLAVSYALAADVDCDVAPFNSGAGFAPIRDFAGTLDGNYHKVTGLYINRPGSSQVALFGFINMTGATITRLGLEDVVIVGGMQSGPLGGWLGPNVGISQCWATGAMQGTEQVGGLVGTLYGSIGDSYSRVNVLANNQAGGLVGALGGRLANTYATGAVQGGTCGGGCGGLVGLIGGSSSSPPEITNSFAAGPVTGGGFLGGLVGRTFFPFPTPNTFFDMYRTGRSVCLGDPAGNPAGCTGVNAENSTPDYWFVRANAPMSSWSFPPWASRTGDFPYFASNGPPLRCVGFGPPLDSGPVTAKKGRAFPFKAELFDADGRIITDLLVGAAPVIQVMFVGTDGGAPADVTDQALSVGLATEGNQFVFTDGRWQFNLMTKNYTAPGTYRVSMVSGDSWEYVVDPTCQADFVIK